MIKPPARRLFDGLVMQSAPRLTRRFIYADTAACDVTRADVFDALADADTETSTRLLFILEKNADAAAAAVVAADADAAVKAGTLNPVTLPIRPQTSIEAFFCEKRPAFL